MSSFLLPFRRLITTTIYLKFIDLGLLWCIMRYIELIGTPPTLTALQPMYNKWVHDQSIGIAYTDMIGSRTTMEYAIERLHRAKLIEPRNKNPVPSKSGLALMDKLGPNWRKWPIKLHSVNGDLDWSHVEYAPPID